MDAIVLELPKIPGECSLKGYEKKIELNSIDSGVSMPMTGSATNTERTSGSAVIEDIRLTKYVDISSALIYQACCEATIQGTAKLTIARNDSGNILPLLVFELEDVLIASASLSCSKEGGIPLENVTLNFTKITWTYSLQKEGQGKAGEVIGSWDASLNQASRND